MFCGECGTRNPDTNHFCKNCGRPLKTARPALPVSPHSPGLVTAPAQPVSYAPPAAAQRVTDNPPAVTGNPQRTWLGIVSLIPAIASWILYPVLLGIIAVVLGMGSLWLWKQQGTRFPASAVIAIIVGLLAIVINIFWLDIFPPPQVLPPIE